MIEGVGYPGNTLDCPCCNDGTCWCQGSDPNCPYCARGRCKYCDGVGVITDLELSGVLTNLSRDAVPID